MDRTDVLLTIAEVAVAFAGFASLASLIGRDSSGTDPRVDAVRSPRPSYAGTIR